MSKSTKSENWFAEHCIEDQKDISAIAEIAKKTIFDKLSIGIKSDDIIMSLYGITFDVIKEYIKEQQSDHSEYSINIAGRLEMGYTNRDDEKQEKAGNYMIYMKCLENKAKETEIDDDESKSIELAAQWNAANITSNVEAIKEISERAYKRLDEEVDITLGSLELVIPLFCMIHEVITSYLKIKRVELKVEEYEINLCNIAWAGAKIDENGDDYAYLRPLVTTKRELKDDKSAAGSDVEE